MDLYVFIVKVIKKSDKLIKSTVHVGLCTETKCSCYTWASEILNESP